MRFAFCVFVVLLCALPGAAQQSCTRAFATLAEARRKANRGDTAGADGLLRQAELECPRENAALNAEIAEIYRLLRTPEKAIPYQWAAERGGRSAVRRKFALVVGVGTFRYINAPLQYAGNDARDVHEFLVAADGGRFPRTDARLRTGTDATLENVKDDLEWIAGQAQEDDLVLLYFSTHGSRPGRDASKNQSSYLVLHGTEKSRLFATGLGLDELTHYLTKKLRAQRIVVLLDTCYSGNLSSHLDGSKSLEDDEANGWRPPAEILRQPVAQDRGLVMITSSDLGELSWESDELKKSFFTHHLLQAFREHGPDASLEVAFQTIAARIPPAVEEYTRRTKKGPNGLGATQHPQIFPKAKIPYLVIGTPIR